MLYQNEKEKCVGCTACASVCPVKAIVMKPDEEGFLYPNVDEECCIHCGQCEKVCPVMNPAKKPEGKRRTFLVRTKDADILKQSTSGGFATPLAQWVLKNGGSVCAAAYDEEFRVVHRLFTGENADISSIRGSKYVQSDLGSSFQIVQSLLKDEKTVLFVGTPCQVAGLKGFLKKEYEKLITVDLVCHGVPSPKLWEKYRQYQQERFGAPIQSVSFRNKTYGYHSGTMKMTFANGKEYYASGRVDGMLKAFYSDVSSRPSCYACPMKGLERCSDFTIMEGWHASVLVPGLKDDDRGYTSVVVQSVKGLKALERLQDVYDCYEVDTQKAVELDGIMVENCAKSHPKRHDFYKELDKEPFPVHIQKFVPIRRKDYLLEGAKKYVYRIGVYRKVKKILKGK